MYKLIDKTNGVIHIMSEGDVREFMIESRIAPDVVRLDIEDIENLLHFHNFSLERNDWNKTIILLEEWRMARKVWYEIELISVHDSSCETIAKVKSEGLANIVYSQLKELYKNNKDVLLHVK